MLLHRENNTFKINGKRYSLLFPKDRPFAFDDTVEILGVGTVKENAEGCAASIQTMSPIWEREVYRFRCTPEKFSYEMTVYEQGQLAKVNGVWRA